MAIQIRDEHLEARIDAERTRRGDATMAKTLGDLVREKLTEIEVSRTKSTQPPSNASLETPAKSGTAA